jgi:hypothetical protein
MVSVTEYKVSVVSDDCEADLLGLCYDADICNWGFLVFREARRKLGLKS